MRYFATADDKETAGKISKSGSAGMTEVEEQILGKPNNLYFFFPHYCQTIV